MAKKKKKFRPKRDVDKNGQTNAKRAARGETALVAWLGTDRRDSDDDKTHAQDLLCDLMHFACREGFDFWEAVEDARTCYEDER